MLYISKQDYPTREDVLKMYSNEKVILEDKNFWKIPSRKKARLRKKVWTSCKHSYTILTSLSILYDIKPNKGLCAICERKKNALDNAHKK